MILKILILQVIIKIPELFFLNKNLIVSIFININYCYNYFNIPQFNIFYYILLNNAAIFKFKIYIYVR